MNKLRTSSFNIDNSENVAYDNPAFPAYIRSGSFNHMPHYNAVLHWHEDLEFMVVFSGSITYEINGENLQVQAMDGIFVNSRQVHNIYPNEGEECRFLCILLHPSLLTSNAYYEEKYVNPLIHHGRISYQILHHENDWQQQIIQLLEEMTEAQGKPMVETIVQRDFFEIFHLLYEGLEVGGDNPIETEQKEQLNTLKTMILYLQENYREHITLDNIAASVPCSKSKCSNLFRKYLNSSPVAYLTKYRLHQSCQQLLTTENTITEIALACGFNGSSYYCETFKKYYGMTPLAYRNS